MLAFSFLFVCAVNRNNQNANRPTPINLDPQNQRRIQEFHQADKNLQLIMQQHQQMMKQQHQQMMKQQHQQMMGGPQMSK